MQLQHRCEPRAQSSCRAQSALQHSISTPEFAAALAGAYCEGTRQLVGSAEVGGGSGRDLSVTACLQEAADLIATQVEAA